MDVTRLDFPDRYFDAAVATFLFCTLPDEWRAQNVRALPPPQRTVVDEIALFYFPIAYAGAIALVFIARGVRTLRERRRGMFTVSYPSRQVRVPKGLSVLEASLRFKIPHASVLRWSRPLFDLPRSRRQRPRCVAPALGTRGIRAGAGGR
jgi:hypothetical protein